MYYISERDVLKPRDPSLTDDNEWECFVLSNVEVYDATTHALASLLDAHALTPVTVRGRLEPPERRQAHCLLRRPYGKPVNVQIDGVTRFAYAQDESNGDIVLWAAGEAGWFEIRPARSYRDIYQHMALSIQLLYFAADSYSGGARPSAELVFREYAEDRRFACTDPKAAAQLFYDHREFLLTSMMNRMEGIVWGHTSLYLHLKTRFPEDVARIRSKIEGKVVLGTASEEAPPTPRSDRTPQPSHAEPQNMLPAPLGAQSRPRRDGNWWRAKVIWAFVQKVHDQDWLSPGQITVRNLSRLLVKQYELSGEEQALHHICAHGSNIRYMMEHPKRQRHVDWTGLPLYNELGSITLPAATMRIASAIDLRRRRGALSGPAEHSSSDSEDSTSASTAEQPERTRRGKYSALRPPGQKTSSKSVTRQTQTQRHTTAHVASEVEADVVLIDYMDLDPPAKRKFAESSGASHPRKRAVGRASSHPSSSSSSEDENENKVVHDQSSTTLPLRWKDNNNTTTTTTTTTTAPSFQPTLVTKPIPTASPNAPANIFLCAIDGCAHRIYGADAPPGPDLIKEHYQWHAARQKEQLAVVMHEEQQSRLPVSNLIKRIRDVADASPVPPPRAARGREPAPPHRIERWY